MDLFTRARRTAPPGPTAALIILIAFAVVVALLGGASRADAVQIAALRPLAGLFLVAGFYFITREQLERAKPLLVLVGLFAVWMGLQLVPLPPALWHSLPGREGIAELDRLAALGDVWRPISLTPSRGLNALLSLVVPISALFLALSMRAGPRLMLLLIAGLGLFDAAWGLLQAIGGRTSPLYTYAITNRGLPVGLFANENHSAVLSAICLLVITRLGVTSLEAKEPMWLRLVYAPGFLIVLLALMVSGSRAGLATGALSLVAAALMLVLALPKRNRRGRSRAQGWIERHPRSIPAGIAGLIALMIGVFVALERAPAFSAILTQSTFDDLRWKIVPVLEEMIRMHWLFGTGFGSWDKLYQIYEPTALLMASYVNQAHNDWAQILIEGGLPAAIVLGAVLVWIVRSVGALVGARDKGLLALLFWGPVFVIVCAASLVDYPLRTPTFQMIGVWLLLTLALERAELQQAEK